MDFREGKTSANTDLSDWVTVRRQGNYPELLRKVECLPEAVGGVKKSRSFRSPLISVFERITKEDISCERTKMARI
jgi:hypothetical protein